MRRGSSVVSKGTIEWKRQRGVGLIRASRIRRRRCGPAGAGSERRSPVTARTTARASSSTGRFRGAGTACRGRGSGRTLSAGLPTFQQRPAVPHESARPRTWTTWLGQAPGAARMPASTDRRRACVVRRKALRFRPRPGRAPPDPSGEAQLALSRSWSRRDREAKRATWSPRSPIPERALTQGGRTASERTLHDSIRGGPSPGSRAGEVDHLQPVTPPWAPAWARLPRHPALQVRSFQTTVRPRALPATVTQGLGFTRHAAG